jgi:ribonuclease HI
MKVMIYTDGGCEPNPGQGAWAFVCVSPYFEMSGFNPNTTSNQMEITAVLEAVKHAKEICATDILVVSDSQYTVKGFNDWSKRWRVNGWKRQEKGVFVPVKNAALWRELDSYRGFLKLQWIKGHNGNEFNERADELVRSEYEKHCEGQMRY